MEHIYYSEFSIIKGYHYRIETIGVIKNIECYDKTNCSADIEYIVNNTKYLTLNNIPNNLKIGDKIKVRYNPNNPKEALVYGNMHIYSYIYISLLIIFIILLWMILFNVVLYKNTYNKYMFLIYAIFFTIVISYVCYINIHNNYFNDLNKYDDYEDYTIGLITKQEDCYSTNYDDKKEDEMCYSNIEYLIDGVKHNVKLLTFYYKVGENVRVYYNKDTPEAIKIYDKTENKRFINIIIYTIILLLLWICLFYSIPLILYLRK